MTLRHGPSEPGREMYRVSVEEVEELETALGLHIIHRQHFPDMLGRAAVSWDQICLEKTA